MSVGGRSRCFVASSAEGLKVAQAIQVNLEHDAEVTLWTQGIFELSDGAIDSLVAVIQNADFAVLVFSPDDVLRIRGETQRAARDNVILELGIAIGVLGRRRSFIVTPRNADDLRIPTDLIGMTPAAYDSERSDSNLLAGAASACYMIRQAIEKLGPRAARRDSALGDPLALVIEGIRSVNLSIKKAYGPRGTMIGIASHGEVVSSDLGVEIAAATTSPNPFIRHGGRIMGRAAEEMWHRVGDGTKIVTLLAARMIERGLLAKSTGLPVEDIVQGMQTAVQSAIASLKQAAKPVGGSQIEWIASTAASSSECGAAVSAALERAGREGIISVEISDSERRIEIVATEGFTFDRGFVHGDFGAGSTAGALELLQPYIVMLAGRLSEFRDVIPMMETAVKEKAPLLIIADDIDGSALATLLLNHQRGSLHCAGVKAPGHGDRRLAILKDIAAFTGGIVIEPGIGMNIRRVALNHMGRARVARISGDETVLIDGAGSPEAIEERANVIRGQIVTAADDYERVKLEERLAALRGSIVTVRVGGSTAAERQRYRRKITVGVNAARASIAEGWVLGGGLGTLMLESATIAAGERSAGVRAGRQAIEASLGEPARVLASTAKQDETEVIKLLRASGTAVGTGYNVETERFEDLALSGIIDPALVLRRALEISLDTAVTVLRTDKWEMLEPEEPLGTKGLEG